MSSRADDIAVKRIFEDAKEIKLLQKQLSMRLGLYAGDTLMSRNEIISSSIAKLADRIIFSAAMIGELWPKEAVESLESRMPAQFNCIGAQPTYLPPDDADKHIRNTMGGIPIEVPRKSAPEKIFPPKQNKQRRDR